MNMSTIGGETAFKILERIKGRILTALYNMTYA